MVIKYFIILIGITVFSIGMMIGTIFYRSQIQAVFSMTIILVPILIFSGYFKMISQMSSIMAFLSYMSFLRPSMNSMMIAIYGLDRCIVEVQKEFQQIHSMNRTRPDWIDSVATLVDVYATIRLFGKYCRHHF